MDILVSIIIPLFNGEQYISDCLYSVLAQDYPHIEIIVVNDGSTDNGAVIVRGEFQTRDNTIFLYEQENKGAASARNLGILKAHGDYIAFVDCDDLISPYFISQLLDACITNHQSLAYCDYTRALSDFNTKKSDNTIQRVSREDLFNATFSNDPHIRALHISPCNRLYKSDLLEDIYFPDGRLYEDNFFIPKIFAAIESAAYVNVKLYYYRVRENSMTSRSHPNELKDQLDSLVLQYSFLKKSNISPKKAKTIYQNRKINLLLDYYYHSPIHKKQAKKLLLQNLIMVFFVMKSNQLFKFFKLIFKLFFK